MKYWLILAIFSKFSHTGKTQKINTGDVIAIELLCAAEAIHIDDLYVCTDCTDCTGRHSFLVTGYLTRDTRNVTGYFSGISSVTGYSVTGYFSGNGEIMGIVLRLLS